VQIIQDTFGTEPVFVMDGTPKLPEEGFSRDWPAKITMTEEVKRKIDALMPKLGLGAFNDVEELETVKS
jgi:3-polyprenyl-4-hydroxybenzoate decarboxylase